MYQTEILQLTYDQLSEASYLLVNYIYPSGEWGNIHMENCRRNLIRLLDFYNADFWMAKSKGEFVGFIALYWCFSTTKGQPFLRVQDLYVLPQFRRNGIAQLLLNKAVDIAKHNNANRLELNTGTENMAARKLYEKFGFERFPDKEIYMYFFTENSRT